MGIHDNQRLEKQGKSSKRGSVRNASRLEAFKDRHRLGEADWGACDEKRVASVIVAITEKGGAVTFGLSRDQGAHMLTLMLDDARQALWFNGDADLNDELDEVLGVLAAMPDKK